MVRAFARKPAKHEGFSEINEFGWLTNSEPVEISAASLWALEDPADLRRGADEEATEAMTAMLAEDFAPENSASSAGDSDTKGEIAWWKMPQLVPPMDEQAESGPEPIDLVSDTLSAFSDDAVSGQVAEAAVFGDETTLIRLPSTTEIGSPSPIHESDLPGEEEGCVPVMTETTAPAKRRLLVLDESAVLPNEASYATVETPARFNNPAASPIVVSRATEKLSLTGQSRPRVLDESAILPSEASFATVALYQEARNAAHSPLSEFVRRFAFGVKRLAPAFLIVLVVSAGIFYGLRIRPDTIVNNTPAINLEQPVNHPFQAYPKNPSAKAISGPVSVALKETPKPVEPSPALRPRVTTIATKRATVTPLSDQKNSGSRDFRPAKKSVSAKRGEVLSKTRKVDTTVAPKLSDTAAQASRVSENGPTPAPQTRRVASGGGERPRRVNAETTSQSDKGRPKLIDWPK